MIQWSSLQMKIRKFNKGLNNCDVFSVQSNHDLLRCCENHLVFLTLRSSINQEEHFGQKKFSIINEEVNAIEIIQEVACEGQNKK